ncbi:MAG: carbohydrate kinase family protein [Candidatus Altiarchaeota archaeon]
MRIYATAIGDINVDIITSKLRDFPERDAQLLIKNITLTSGGCAANFAKALSILGLKTRLIGKVGNDIFSKFVLNSLTKVDLKISRDEKTASTIAMPFYDNTRAFLTYTGANSKFSIENINFKDIQGYYLHIASFFLQGLRKNTFKILNYAHSKGMITTFDTGWDPKGWSEKDIKLLRKILSRVDIFFPNFREGQKIANENTKEMICNKLLSFGPKIIALKLGKKGSYIATKNERIFIPVFKVRPVDTTGAGDVFDAAFVFGHFKKWSLEKIGNFANAAAALSTLGYGSEKYPTFKEVNKFLNEKWKVKK